MRSVSLRTLLILSFCTLVMGTSVVVTYLSFSSAEQAVDMLVDQAMRTAQERVGHELDEILSSASLANRRLRAALSVGAISLDKPERLHDYLIAQHLR